MQLDHAASALLGRIHNTGIERARINMQTYRALTEMLRIEHAMHRIGGIDRAGMSWIHFDSVGRSELGLSVIEVLRNQVKIFDQKAADWNLHPAILIAMIMDRADLANFPADCDQFV